MTKNIKEIGNRWERELAKELGGKRLPGSGAWGTQHKDYKYAGDVVVKYPWFKWPIVVECKYGYGGNKSMSVKREWFTKVRMEAELSNRYPMIALKFRDVTGGDRESAKVICVNLDVWKQLMNQIQFLFTDYISRLEKEFEEGNNG